MAILFSIHLDLKLYINFRFQSNCERKKKHVNDQPKLMFTDLLNVTLSLLYSNVLHKKFKCR